MIQQFWLVHPEDAMCAAFRERFAGLPGGLPAYWEPPHRLDWDFVVERHKAVYYDGKRQVVR
jgi:hypothetical protein